MSKFAYLAGPEVFEAARDAIFADYSRICRDLGLEPLIPLDATLNDPRQIYDANLGLIQRADLLIANITPFRGPHCDPGTAFEIGHAAALGKPVFGFSLDPSLLIARIPSPRGLPRRDAQNRIVEDFALAENLMIVLALTDRTVHPSFKTAAEAAMSS